MSKAMKGKAAWLALVGIAMSVLPAACTLLYGDYGDRFQGQDAGTDAGSDVLGDALPGDAAHAFVVEDANITHLAATTSALFYSVGGQILSIALDGGDRSVAWTGATKANVVALESNGTTEIAWTYGESVGTNIVYVADAASPAPAVSVAEGQTLGVHTTADLTSVAWSNTPAPPKDGGTPVLQILDWKNGASTVSVSFSFQGKAMGGLAAKAVALSSSAVFGFVSPAGIVRFDRTTLDQKCEERVAPGNSFLELAAVGKDLYVVSSDTSRVMGTLTKYAVPGEGCSFADSGVVLASGDVVVVTSASTGIYWATMAGGVFRAAVDQPTSQQLGTAGMSPTAIAVGEHEVYVAAGNAIYRFAGP
jgi:hypothetical protein